MSNTRIQGYGLHDLVKGKTPTYEGWDTDPTDGGDITDGNSATICTTGSTVMGAAGLYSYIEWDLGGDYTVMCSGIAGIATTASVPYMYGYLYNGTGWKKSYYFLVNAGLHPILMFGGIGSKVRLGLTLNGAGTINPNVQSFHVWRL